jgi:hypothetical protein
LTARPVRANNGLVFTGMFARERERTCAECGYTWRVPRSIARRGIGGMSAISVRGQTAGGRHGQSDTTRLSSDIEARAERMEGFRTCAKCGADYFAQRPCRRGEGSAS